KKTFHLKMFPYVKNTFTFEMKVKVKSIYQSINDVLPFYDCVVNVSSRTSFAACTITFNALIVSFSFLVFNPQSGLTQNCFAGMVASARRIFSFNSSIEGTLGL